jgi:hypothetical protein
MDEGNEEEDESLEADAMIKVTTIFYDKRLHIEMLWIRIRGFNWVRGPSFESWKKR